MKSDDFIVPKTARLNTSGFSPRIRAVFVILILLIISLVFSGCSFFDRSEVLIFLPGSELDRADAGQQYSYSFCKPETSISGAACGGPAGATIDPYGGTPPYTFSVQSGKGFLPPGLGLELNGRLRGTPTLAGTYMFGVCAKDLNNKENCKETSIIVDAKDQTFPEERVPQPEPPEFFDVKIDSLSCTWSVKDNDGVRSDCVRVISTGTAQGPVGARLELPILSWSTDKFDCGSWTHKTGALIAVGHTCARQAGQPETTNWTVDTEGDDCPLKDYFTDSMMHTVKIYKDDDIFSKKQDSKTAECR